MKQNKVMKSSVWTLPQQLSLLLSSIALVGVVVLTTILFWIPTKVAYIRVDEIMEQYKGMTAAKQTYQVQLVAWQANVDTLKVEFETAYKAYETQKDKMTTKQRQEKEQALSKQQQDLMRYSQAMSKKAEEEDQKLTQQVLSQVNSFLEDYGAQQRYKLIFGANGNGSIVYGTDAIDITDEVIKMLNNNYDGI